MQRMINNYRYSDINRKLRIGVQIKIKKKEGIPFTLFLN